MFLKLSSPKINILSIIISNLLILAIFLLFIVSCTAPRSIGNSKKFVKIKTENNNPKDEIKSSPAENKNEAVSQNFTFIPSDEQITNSEVINNSFNRLPTLREQMNTISEEQVRLNSELERINYDINEIKRMLQVISEDLSYIKNGKQSFAAKGMQENKIQGTVILSDEEDKNKNQSNNNYVKFPLKRNETRQSIRNVKKLDSKIQPPAETKNTMITNEVLENAIKDFNNKEYHSSIQKLKSILERDRDQQINSEVLFFLAENYYRLQNYHSALIHYRQVSASPNNKRKDIAQAMIAECLMRLGELNEAKIAYQELITKYPQSEFIPKARKMLQQL